jgi:hypothetical protein
VGGREIQCNIKSIPGDQTHYKIDQHITEIEICTERPIKKKHTENGYVKSLVDIISKDIANKTLVSSYTHILYMQAIRLQIQMHIIY